MNRLFKTHNRAIPVGVVALGGVLSGGLAYLAAHNIWAAVLLFLGGACVTRIWWLAERKSVARPDTAADAADVRDLVSTTSALALEVADLNVQVESLKTPGHTSET